MSTTEMIRFEDVALSQGGFRMTGLTLSVPEGGYALMIGPTGAGKTTLLEAVAGHVLPTQGRILLGGLDMTTVPPEARGVGFVYQSYHLFPHLSVRDNIGYGLRRHPAPEAAARVTELATLLGLTPLLERGIRGLSGGEQQRVALARALAPRPRLLLLDEPFAAVDPLLRRALRHQLRTIREREQVTILHVTHDVEDALRLGDLVAVLDGGRILQTGAPEEVFRFPNSPFVAEFLGSGTVLRGRVVRVRQGSETRMDGQPSGAEETTDGRGRFAARFECAGLALEVIAEREGEGHALIRPEDVLVSRTPFPDYPRNRFTATVTRVERLGPVAQVHLDAAGISLSASVTTATAEALALVPGDAVTAAIKATAVHLF